MMFLATLHFNFSFSPNDLVIIKQSSFGDDLLCSSSLIALQLSNEHSLFYLRIRLQRVEFLCGLSVFEPEERLLFNK